MPVTSMILFMFSRCFMVTTCLRPRKRRAGIIHVMTIAKPEKTAPATKYGGKIVVCQPAMTDVEKSQDTIVWTESTRGPDHTITHRRECANPDYIDSAIFKARSPNPSARPNTARYSRLRIARSSENMRVTGSTAERL